MPTQKSIALYTNGDDGYHVKVFRSQLARKGYNSDKPGRRPIGAPLRVFRFHPGTEEADMVEAISEKMPRYNLRTEHFHEDNRKDTKTVRRDKRQADQTDLAVLLEIALIDAT